MAEPVVTYRFETQAAYRAFVDAASALRLPYEIQVWPWLDGTIQVWLYAKEAA